MARRRACRWSCAGARGPAGLCRPRAAAGPVLRPHHAGAGAILEPARRLCRAGLGRPAGLRRARRLRAVRATLIARPRSADRHPARRPRRRAPRAADRARRLPPARRLFRDRHLGGGGGLPAAPRAGEVARRRHRHVARTRRSPTMAGLGWIARDSSACARPAARDIAPTGWRSLLLAGTLALVYLLLRSRRGLALAAIRDSETAAGQRRRRRFPHQARRLRARPPSAPA